MEGLPWAAPNSAIAWAKERVVGGRGLTDTNVAAAVGAAVVIAAATEVAGVVSERWWRCRRGEKRAR